jgi:hypothetical protein
MMDFCISGEQLRAALADIDRAEANGFMHCLCVFKMTSAGPMLDDCMANYSDLLEKAHPSDARLDWGRFQSVTSRNRFVDGKLERIAT